MHFVGNSAWFGALLLVHVLGAIAGIGPAFTFGILGSMAPNSGPQGALALTKAIHKIEGAMLRPTTLVLQWVSGVLLIFNRGLNNEFFSGRRAWLLISIVLYAILLVMGNAIFGPRTRRMIELQEAGDFGPELQGLGASLKKLGPIPPLLTVAIIVLMVLKPGGSCGSLIRC